MEPILIKVTGELFSSKQTLQNICTHIKKIKETHKIGIVVGAGNLIRGEQAKNNFGIKTTTAHTTGMISTVINGLFLKDFLEQIEVKSIVLNALYMPQITQPITQDAIETALKQNKIIIFTGGTGNPFFTTDTNAVIRTLQIEASQLWKGTTVDGIYTDDPKKNPHATFLSHVTYDEVLQKNLKFMDSTAITLSQKHNIKIRVFNIFEENALINVSQNENFGSIVN
jgi:uridylate kinase